MDKKVLAKKEEREEVKRIMAEKRKVAENLMYAFVLLAATISLVLFFCWVHSLGLRRHDPGCGIPRCVSI